MTRPTCPGKVAAVITRVVDGRTELCVFDHAALVQVPAGTLEPDEAPVDGAVREAWEETGLPHLELVDHLSTFDEVNGDRTQTRHVFHLRATTPTPDEWWVLTPDGGSSQWRCRWVPLGDLTGVHEGQARWVRTDIDPGPDTGRAAPLPPNAVELFWAMSGTRGIVVPHEGERPPPDGTPASAGAVCVTADGDCLLVTEDPEWGWHVPGGRPEGDETPERTLAREVREEACATVVDCELLITHELLELDDLRTVIDHRWSPAFWARVELDPWAPEHEKTDRRLVPLTDVNDDLHWEAPTYLRWLELARAADARHR